MEMKEVMQQQVFAVVGDTLNPEKFACKIKQSMLQAGYTVFAVGKELGSLNDIPEEIDVIDLCINPVKGLQLIKECTRPFKCIVLQPGSDSPELLAYLDEQGLPYLHGCLLIGLEEFPR